MSNASRFPGDPGAHRLYFGENREGGDPTEREAVAQHFVGCYRSYFIATDSVDFIVERCTRDLGAGRLPIISLHLPGTWADMAAGLFDVWLLDRLEALGQLAGPVWFCLHHEPWDDQGVGCTPADFKAMYAHLWALERPANIAVVPILQSGPFDPNGQNYHPGSVIEDWIDPATCDVVGFDIYDHWHVPPGVYWHWRDVPSMLLFCDMVAAAFPGKPMAVCEYGVRTDPLNPGQAAQWIVDYKAALVARGDVVAMSYFDSAQNVNDGGTPWSLDYGGETERLDAWAGQVTSVGSYFLGFPSRIRARRRARTS